MSFTIPAYGWKPRDKQRPAWEYLQSGGKDADLVWHRRFGKDDVMLRHACIATFEEPANYWHMLPQANQVRKAIWKAINPHTGRRRIEEAFPEKLFKWNDHEMFVENKATGGTWQCLGSDNFQGSIGSTPKGIVFSEWAQANPYALGFLRPILQENDGWLAKVGTPRGKNHAYDSYNLNAKRMADGQNAFAELLTVYDTNMVSPEDLLVILQEYVTLYGEEYGLALYMQEYECDWTAQTLGTYYGREMRKLEAERFHEIDHDENWPVHCAMDIGHTDNTCIWFWQNIHGIPKVLEMWFEAGRDPDYVASVITGRQCSISIKGDPYEQKSKIEVEWGNAMPGFSHHQAWDIQTVWIPHDAKAKTFAAKGKSVQEQLAAVFGWDKVLKVPDLSRQDGIQACRKFLNLCEMDSRIDIEALKQYRREWDEANRRFRDHPLHNWCSDVADGARYMAIANRHDTIERPMSAARYPLDRTFNQWIEHNRKKRRRAAQ